MVLDHPSATRNSKGEVDDPTSASLLADTHDQLINVPVRRANGTIEQRPYEVHLPNGLHEVPLDQHLPVVFAFDGTTANKPYTGMAVDNKINAEADKDGFIAVYPLPKPRIEGFGFGTNKTMRDWNAPGVGALPTDNTYNDVDYVRSVIADVNNRFHPQAGIHGVGMSLGGEFLQKLDHDLPTGTFADNYIVSSTSFRSEGLPPAGMPAKFVRGDNDPILPDNGGMHPSVGIVKNFVMRQFEETKRTDLSCPPCMVQDFLMVNGFPTTSKTTDFGTYRETVYRADQSGTPIIVDTVKNAGHFWFGRERGGSHETVATDANGTNPPASAFDATADMARFFGLSKR